MELMYQKNLLKMLLGILIDIDAGYKNRLIAQKGFDETHVLRVVYESVEEKFVVITVYPGRRSRYEKN